MSYLSFDKTLLVNLERSLHKEMLCTNRSGVYNCTTLVDCNTRKYHGQLVMPISELGNDNFVLLSSLDETVIQHGAEFNLGLHRYNGMFLPNGHKYIREFSCDLMPTTIYRVGGVILKKEVIFQTFEDRILLHYCRDIRQQFSEGTLPLKPPVGRFGKELKQVVSGLEA